MKKLSSLFAVLFILVGFLNATAINESAAGPTGIVITDSYDREVSFDSTPERIISVAPSVTEIVYALGKGDGLIGRTDYCDYPAEAASVESVGSLMEPNIEKIIDLEPDVVIVSTHFKPENIEILENAGVKVVGFYNDESFEAVYDIIANIGLLLDAESEAETLVAQMKADVADVKEKVASVKNRPSVYYVVGFGEWGDFTAGGDTFIHELLEMAGGNNIARDAQGWAFSLEKIVEADPEIMICSMYYDMKAGLESADGYKDLNAVKNGNLYVFDNNMVDRQGPRLAKGLMAFAKIIHPELFE